MNDQKIIEAALFTAGSPVDLITLKGLVTNKKRIQKVIGSLIKEYHERKGALEILKIEGKFVMQVKPEYCELVRSIAPGELSPPVLRTLSIIAYHQPIVQSELVDKRGNAVYDHVRELEEWGLISRSPQGRTKIINTTPWFAEYFGLDSSDPEYIRQRIAQMSTQQGQAGLDKWLGMKKPIGVTRGYLSLIFLLGIENFKVVEPYNPTDNDIERIKTMGKLVISNGYGEKVAQYFNGEIIEIQAVTFDDLLVSFDKLSHLGRKDKVKEAVAKVQKLKEEYLSKSLGITTKVRPATDMIARLIADMKLNMSSDGLLIAPDYGLSAQGVDVSRGADILVPTHANASADIVERVCKRYGTILEGINNYKKNKLMDKI
ncbi:MAG: SMC-Scp complex subunit ScpB [Methanosarcinales archaeon]|nr:SMC-Scp complex subunit ScpB [Methanosarcinales archaeon]